MAVGAGDVVRVDMRSVYNGSTAIQNVFHLRNDGTSVDEEDVIDDMVEIIEALYVLLAGILQVLQVVQDIRVINVTDETDVGFGSFVDDTPGTQSNAVVAQDAYGLILDTQRLASKGRKFFGPASTANVTSGGILTSTPLAALADVGDDMIVPAVATNSTWRHGIVSTLEGVGFLPFVGYGISATVVTQRRRRIGVGI